MNINPRLLHTSSPLFAELDRWLGHAFSQVPDLADDTHVYENADTRFLVVELPGFRRDEVTVKLEGSILSLEAKPSDETRPFLVELQRRWKLNDDTDFARIEARFEHGVLNISLPKRAEENISRTIEIL